MIFSIDSGIPIYLQIYSHIERRIAGGSLRPGDALPSVRALAVELVVNPMTISKAYSRLKAQRLIIEKRGVGMVVHASARILDERMAMLAPVAEQAAAHAFDLSLSGGDLFRAVRAAWRRISERP